MVIIRIDSEDLPSHGRLGNGRVVHDTGMHVRLKNSGGSAGAGGSWEEEGRTRSALQEEEKACFCLAVFGQSSVLRLWL